ncbi:MAG: TatD family hydrolase [Luteolibacter sp.]|jgi:TatD DNase family protein|nr:TatD family hydrolase [Luteolibacter sp.]
MELWTDSHNHLQDPRLGGSANIIAGMRDAGVGHCVVNATCEADWPAVEALALAHPDFISPAFGIHPWRAHTATHGWQERLVKLLEKHPTASIGECGLDQWVESPPLEIQRPVFLDQVRLARGMHRALTIHCIKAWGGLFETFAECPPPPRFLMHSFGGSIEIARRLLPLGAYFSFSGYFLHARKAAVLEVFRQLPRARILLESDAPDMLPPEEVISHVLPQKHNHPANLPAIGKSLATALGIMPEELARLTRTNAGTMFH